MSRYAYATFLMRGDGYLPGALVLAHALKTQSSHDRICLVTADVSHRARGALGCVYDRVIPIDEVRFKSGLSHGRQDRGILMTRFEALRVEGYDKIILLDADVLPIWGYDGLFALPAPAGIIMERKEDCYSGAGEAENHWSWHDLYGPVCPHGTAIPKEITDRVRRDPTNMGVNAGLWVLGPSQREYDEVQSYLRTPEAAALVRGFPWPEMQLATLLWSGRWTNIDIRYCSIGGYPRLDALYGIHFAGLKPWQVRSKSAAHYARFPDFALWRTYYASLYWQTPLLREIPALRRLWEFCREMG
jgi:glycogenin glucosyltransferase